MSKYAEGKYLLDSFFVVFKKRKYDYGKKIIFTYPIYVNIQNLESKGRRKMLDFKVNIY